MSADAFLQPALLFQDSDRSFCAIRSEFFSAVFLLWLRRVD